MPKRRTARRKPVSTVITLTKNIHLTITGDSPFLRLRRFTYRHHHSLFVLAVVITAVGLIVMHERSLAKVTLASIAGEVIQFFGDVVVDRLFPGGEFTKPV